MWSGINGDRHIPDEPRCPTCRRTVHAHYAEREYEGENPLTDELESCNAIEAWINCSRCGWLTERLNDQMWSDEVFGDDPLTNDHIERAMTGAIEFWREYNKSFHKDGKKTPPVN